MGPDAADPWGLRAALDGDQDAWAAIVGEFGTTIWRWARSYRLGREDAEDVCQSVWYLLKDKGGSIDDPRRLAGWLATTTRHEALAMTRRRHRPSETTVPLDSIAELPTRRPDSPTDQTLAGDLRRRLTEAFRQLSQGCRELLALLWDDAVDYQEIAETLGMSLGSIGPTRARCLASLRSLANVT